MQTSIQALRGRPKRERMAAAHRCRLSRSTSTPINAAGVTISVSTVAKPSPNTIAVER